MWAVCLLLALSAVTLTIARMSGSERTTAVQVQAFAPLAIPLYAALVLVLLVVLLRADQRTLPGVAALLATALLTVHVTWVAPLVRAEAAPPGEPLTVMSANLWRGRADVGEVLAVARESDVSLLVLEEVRPAALARLEVAGVAESFPYRVGDPGDTMVLSRSPLTEPEPLLDGTGSWAVTWQGRRVYAVHSSYPRRNADWRRDLAELAQAARAERPDLMLGDFNATRDHRPFRTLLDVGYRDAAEQAGAGWQPTWPAPGTTRQMGVLLPPTVAIDHVLVGPGLVAASTHTRVVGGTDHQALVARLVAPGS